MDVVQYIQGNIILHEKDIGEIKPAIKLIHFILKTFTKKAHFLVKPDTFIDLTKEAQQERYYCAYAISHHKHLLSSTESYVNKINPPITKPQILGYYICNWPLQNHSCKLQNYSF